MAFMLSFNFVYAKKGYSKDETLFFLAICGVLLVTLAILYAIDFIKKIIKQHKNKKTNDLEDIPTEEE